MLSDQDNGKQDQGQDKDIQHLPDLQINPETGSINFLGNGSFIGGILRYNALQFDGWFFDVLGSASYERSKITPSLFPQFLGSNIRMGIWGVGVNLHRSTDMTNSSATFMRNENFDGSDSGEFNTARTGADDDFTIYTTTAAHSHFLDANKAEWRSAGWNKWGRSDYFLTMRCLAII